MKLNNVGRMINQAWTKLSGQFRRIQLDQYILMPNHLHGIIIIQNDNFMRATTRVAPTIGQIVGAFKSITTNLYFKEIKNNDFLPLTKKLWQRSFYEHIIRSEESLFKIREYILNNPVTWKKDAMYQEPILKSGSGRSFAKKHF